MSGDRVMEKRLLNISLTGVQSKAPLLVPGVTTWGANNTLDKYIVINVHEIALAVSQAATIELFLGDQVIWSRTTSAAEELRSRDDDIYVNTESQQPLSVSLTGGNAIGWLRWSINWAGGNRVKTAENI